VSETGDPASTGSPSGVEPRSLGRSIARARGRCRVLTRRREWNSNDDAAAAAGSPSNCATGASAGATGIAARRAQRRPGCWAFGAFVVGTVGPRMDGWNIALPSGGGVLAGKKAWGIILPRRCRMRHTSFPKGRCGMARSVSVNAWMSPLLLLLRTSTVSESLPRPSLHAPSTRRGCSAEEPSDAVRAAAAPDGCEDACGAHRAADACLGGRS